MRRIDGLEHLIFMTHSQPVNATWSRDCSKGLPLGHVRSTLIIPTADLKDVVIPKEEANRWFEMDDPEGTPGRTFESILPIQPQSPVNPKYPECLFGRKRSSTAPNNTLRPVKLSSQNPRTDECPPNRGSSSARSPFPAMKLFLTLK